MAKSTKSQEPSEHYKWFDRFECIVKRKGVTNPLQPETTRVICTGFELGKNIGKVFIEPHIAAGFNDFIPGHDSGSGGGNPVLYVPAGEHKNGDFYPYRKFAEVMRAQKSEISVKYDKRRDINILLADHEGEELPVVTN